ncbi:MAG: Xylulose kinase [uncultured Phycisphaerae bacterium]|uniref:Xylulose kinase n=1 Tax=uncultured Phycisphaerae bacterium TaxID=904963 RepID=A0A6J4QI69_9BACT|nr:MAG: Xylulose kinase [uncultured Phycisphaerae bacterium]
MPHLLGIDIGTSGTKTLICDEDGKVLATAMAEHPIFSPKPGWSEQEPEDWWTATCTATKAVLKKAKVKPADVGGIGLSGQMHGSVFLGDGTKALRRALLWNDQRTAEQCRQIEAKAGGREALIELVANPALTGFTAPKILWLREHEPKTYAKVKHILLPKDYIRLRMTGEYATEVSDASGMLLLDVKSRTWSDKLLSLLEIDKGVLGKLYESAEVTGTLHEEGARALGLRPGIPVVGGAGDQAAGAVGNGIVSAGIVSATLGTSGVVFAHSEQPTLDPLGRVHTMCHAVPGKWCVFGCMLSAGGSFQWLRNTLGQDEVSEARKRKVDPYELLVEQAATAPAGCEGLFFLPYLTGERCPHPDPNARGGWIGLTARTSRAMLIRSLMEGVTFGMRDALEIMRQMNIPVTQVRASGGGARSPFWRQLQADVYQTPIVLTNAMEGPAYGVALLAGVGTGVWSSVEEACKRSIKQTEKVAPNKKSAAGYDKFFRTYDKLYGDLKERYTEMAALATT